MSGLVLVSGLPASGKSTLAHRLSGDLGWPLLSRDRIRAAAFPAVAAGLPHDEYWRVGRAIDLIINEFAGRMLDVGSGAVIDSNFNWVQQADAIRSLIALRRCACFEVCLWAEREVCRRRFIERNDPPLSAELEPIFERAVSRPREPVLTTADPIAHVDTTNFAGLNGQYPQLLADVQRHFSLLDEVRSLEVPTG